MTTLPQYNIEPKSVLHDATRCQAFNFAKSDKPTPIWVTGQDHTRVPNIIQAQKMPYFDDTFYPKELKLRGETKADKEYKQVDKKRFSLDQNQITDYATDRQTIKRWREKVILKTEVKRRYNLNKATSPQVNQTKQQRWLTSYDTKEISTLLKPQESPFDSAMPYLSPNEIFQTSTQTDQKTTTFNDKNRTFGPDQARILRHNMDLTSKKFMIQNKDYQDVVNKLQTQIDTNFQEKIKSKHTTQVTKLSPQTEKYLQTSIDVNLLQSANNASGEKDIGYNLMQSQNQSHVPLSLDQQNQLRIKTTDELIRNRDNYEDQVNNIERAAQMQTSYNRSFCGRDSSRDVQIDRIMRNTLNAGFKTISPLKDSKLEYCLDQNVDKDDTPWAHATSQCLKKSNQGRNSFVDYHNASTSSAQVNFHQTPLDIFPFRNTQKVRNQSSIDKSPQQSKIQLKNVIRNGSQQVSYWAGMRIDGPISPHERREVQMTKLQTSWFAGGLFGPRTHYGYGRMK